MPQPIDSHGDAPLMAEWSIQDSLKDEALKVRFRIMVFLFQN
jgi:hypothetical protein